MKQEIKEIAKNSIYLYLVQGLNYLLPLVTLPYLLSTLSVDSFGRYSFAFAFSQVIILFVDFGFNLSVTKKIAENFDNDFFVKDIFWRVSLIKILFLILSIIVTIIIVFSSEKVYYYREEIVASFVMILGSTIFPIWWFQGMNNMKTLSLINALSKLLTYPFIFLLVKNENDSVFAILIQSMSLLLAGILSLVYLFIKFKHYFKNINLKISVSLYKNDIKEAWPIFLSNSSISLYTSSLTLLLGIFSNPYSVGLFGAMERIVRVFCFGILGPINQACFPIIARVKQVNFNEAKVILKYVFFTVLSLLILVYIFYIIFNQFIITYFMEGFNDEKTMLTIFMLMIFPIALGGVAGQLGLLALGGELHKKIFSKIYIITGSLSLPLSVLLIYLYKVEGAIASMMIVEIVIFVCLFFNVKKHSFL